MASKPLDKRARHTSTATQACVILGMSLLTAVVIGIADIQKRLVRLDDEIGSLRAQTAAASLQVPSNLVSRLSLETPSVAVPAPISTASEPTEASPSLHLDQPTVLRPR